jgi:hypothetical protein
VGRARRAPLFAVMAHAPVRAKRGCSVKSSWATQTRAAERWVDKKNARTTGAVRVAFGWPARVYTPAALSRGAGVAGHDRERIEMRLVRVLRLF